MQHVTKIPKAQSRQGFSLAFNNLLAQSTHYARGIWKRTTHQMFSVLTTLDWGIKKRNSPPPAILDLCLRSLSKTSVREITCLSQLIPSLLKNFVFQIFSVHRKRKAGVFKFLRFEECFLVFLNGVWHLQTTDYRLQQRGKYKTWTPGPWTPSVDRVKYGPGPWTLSWTGSMDPLFLLPLKLLK